MVARAEFQLRLGKTVIGTLYFTADIWTFEYSNEMKESDQFRSIPSFPGRTNKYRTKYLWPFFRLRVPSIAQPGIKKIIEREQINPADWSALLQRFGGRCIKDPYQLVCTFTNNTPD